MTKTGHLLCVALTTLLVAGIARGQQQHLGSSNASAAPQGDVSQQLAASASLLQLPELPADATEAPPWDTPSYSASDKVAAHRVGRALLNATTCAAHHFGTLVYLNSSTTGGLGTPGAACPLPSTRPYCGAAPLKSLKLIATEAGTTRATGQHIGDAYIFCDSASCYFTSIGVYDDTLRCQWYLDDVPATRAGAPGYSCLSYAIPRSSLDNGTHYFVGTFGYVPRGATCRCSSCQAASRQVSWCYADESLPDSCLAPDERLLGGWAWDIALVQPAGSAAVLLAPSCSTTTAASCGATCNITAGDTVLRCPETCRCGDGVCDAIEAVSPTYNCPADGCPALPTPRACQPHPPPAPPPLADGAPIVMEPAYAHPASNKWVMALMAIGLAGAMVIITLCCWIYNVSHYLKNKPPRPLKGGARGAQGKQQAVSGKGVVGTAGGKQGGGGSGATDAPGGGKGPAAAAAAAAAKATSSGSVNLMGLARASGERKKVQARARVGTGADAAGGASGAAAGGAGSTAKMARAASSGSSGQDRGQAAVGAGAGPAHAPPPAGRPPLQAHPSGRPNAATIAMAAVQEEEEFGESEQGA